MAMEWRKPKPVAPGAFLARIKENQTDGQRRANEILRKVRAVYLPTDGDREVDEGLATFLNDIELELDPDGDGTAPRVATRGGRVLVVTGASGAGKTRLLGEAFLRRPEFAGFGVEGEACALVSVVAPSPFTLKALGNEFVRKMGYVGKREIPEGEVWPMIRILTRELGIRVLHIDEAQHGDQITNPQMFQIIENTFKRLFQDVEWPLWLVLSGLPELANFCQDDRSVSRRVRHVALESLRFPHDVGKVSEAIRDIAAPCPELDVSRLQTDEFVHRLMHASLFQFGIMVEYVQDAIQERLATGKTDIWPVNFADAYTARTGERTEDLNVFLAERWYEIDVEHALYEQPADENGQKVGRRRLKRSPGR